MAINVNDFIKVKSVKSGLVSVVPARNKPHYVQANDIEKSELYKISTPTEEEILAFYPNLTSKINVNQELEQSVKEHKSQMEAKDAEIEKLKKQLEEASKKNKGKGKEDDLSNPSTEAETKAESSKTE